MKVGREPFTEEVRRAIETQNPGLRFDWARLMATPLPAPDVEHWRERRRMERAARQAAREPDEAEGEQSEAGQPSQQTENVIVEGDGADVPADATLSASESTEPPAAGAVGSGVVAPSGARRRRRRRGRRTPNLQTGAAPSPVVPNVPGPPNEDV